MYADLIGRLTELKKRTETLAETLDLEGKAKRIAELDEKMAQPDFWSSKDRAQDTINQANALKREVEPVRELRRSLSDMLELAEIGAAEDDASTLAELEKEAATAAGRIEEVELKAVLNEPHDAGNAFLSIHAGAGGTEACDWTSMLARMYTRFAERQGFKVEMVDAVDGEEAGVRNITYRVNGPYAFGFLKGEAGVHRLVRISPFDAKARRQTSFAAVDVMPEVPETDKNIELNPADLQIETCRSGGAGGQHVNKVESAVRIVHIPTGVVVRCQNERSQHANRDMAMRMLVAKLIRMEEAKREEELQKLYGDKGDISFGYQIRSYVLQPYTMVKDLRTDVETGNATSVLDGSLMNFIRAYLRWHRKENNEKAP